jgi:hypothetical protein
VDQYRIEKLRKGMSVRLLGGDVIEGFVFLQQVGYTGTPETALEMLNQDDPYFPIARDDSGVLLIAKHRLVEAWGEAVGEDDELLIASSPTVRAELRLASAAMVSGMIRMEVRADRPRLLDYLNESLTPFLRVNTSAGARVINARLIESARPLDG